MSTSRLSQLTIIAPGLLGGSAAMAAHARGAAGRIVVWSRRPESRVKLREQAWCSEVADTPGDAVRAAELVVIAAPVDRIVELVREIAPSLPPGAVVTDVGSVKGEITRLGTAALLGRAYFVGGHPMAGSEKTGWENGDPRLFEGRTCFVTPLPSTDVPAAEKVARFWRDCGSEVVSVHPDAHDEIVAHISHLPQVLASTLCAFLGSRTGDWHNFAGGGLRDTTRIAASDPRLWRTIIEQNRDELLRALRGYEDELHSFTAALANRNYVEVVARLERGKVYRDKVRPAPNSKTATNA